MLESRSEFILAGPPLAKHYRGYTFQALLEKTARVVPDVRQSFWSDGEVTTISFAELESGASQLVRAFASLGLQAGDRVAIQMPNSIETSLAFRACLMFGLVVVPVVHIYGPSELTFILNQSRAKILIVPDRWRKIDFIERIRQLGDCPNLQHIIISGKDGPNGTLSWSALMAGTYPTQERSITKPEDDVLLLYTSGTSSAPKGVRHTNASVLAEMDQRLASGDKPDSTSFSAWPPGHIGGFLSLISPQVGGGPSILMDHWSPEPAAKLFESFGVTRTAGVPVFLAELLDAAAASGANLSAVTSYMTGAANVPPSLVERAEKAGIAVFRCYGSTEHPTITASHPSDPLEVRAYTDGSVLAGGEIRLLDDDDRDVAGVADGEVVTRGPEQFRGYDDEVLNRDAFLPGGWFRTGDIGRVENGFLSIVDRKKDIIIRGGENISSKEVEDIVARMPEVAEVAAFAVPHERLGECVCVAAVLRSGAALSLEDVQAFFRSSGVARQKTPERFEVRQEFPRTPSGKIRKIDLRKHYGQP